LARNGVLGVLVVRRAFGHEDNGPDGKPRALARVRLAHGVGASRLNSGHGNTVHLCLGA
jgi:hypothetical protein